jgi:hypothetical protein
MGAPVGNKNAAKAKVWAKALEREVARLEGGDLEKGLDRLARKVVAAADQAGDQWALKEIGERFDGKPTTVIAGDPDSPVTFQEILIRGVDATGG